MPRTSWLDSVIITRARAILGLKLGLERAILGLKLGLETWDTRYPVGILEYPRNVCGRTGLPLRKRSEGEYEEGMRRRKEEEEI